MVTSITNGRGYTRTYTYSDRGEPTSLTLPDGSVTQWAYDAEGNTTSYTNALNQTILYSYNDAGWQTGVDYPAGMTDTLITYNGSGHQTALVDGMGTSSYTYNAAGEVVALSTPQGSINYAYNLAGQVTSMTDVGVGTTTTAYDTAGRPSSVTDAFGDVSTYAYDSAGRLSQKNNPNGTYEQYSYDSRNRVTSIVTKNSGGTVLQSRAYTFDLASQVTQVVEGGITTTYGYDLAGQLTSESKSSGYSASYTYDGNGNRLTRTVGGVTETYTYDNGDKLTAITGGSDPRTFSYDAAGRTTAIVRGSGTTAFAYDFQSRVTSITAPGMTTNTFTYNGLDTRVGKVDSSGSKTFKRAGVGVTAPVLSDGSASYTPTGEVRGGVKTTFHSALKNADVQTSTSGAVTASKVYDAFGNQVSAAGTWNSPFEYAGGYGYQQDGDTGLKLLGHRYYDASTGRFLTRDPIQSGRNWYTYSGNSPVGAADPNGLLVFSLGLEAGAQAVVGIGGNVGVTFDPWTGDVGVTVGWGVAGGAGGGAGGGGYISGSNGGVPKPGKFEASESISMGAGASAAAGLNGSFGGTRPLGEKEWEPHLDVGVTLGAEADAYFNPFEYGRSYDRGLFNLYEYVDNSITAFQEGLQNINDWFRENLNDQVIHNDIFYSMNPY